MAFLFLTQCCEPQKEDAEIAFDVNCMDEKGLTVVAQPTKTVSETETAPTLLTQTAKDYAGSVKIQDQSVRNISETSKDQQTLSTRSHASVDKGLEYFAGTWSGVDGTCIGRIEGDVMTWAGDSAPSEVRLSPLGELMVEVDGEFYQASLKDDSLHFSDGDVWKKVVPVIEVE